MCMTIDEFSYVGECVCVCGGGGGGVIKSSSFVCKFSFLVSFFFRIIEALLPNLCMHGQPWKWVHLVRGRPTMVPVLFVNVSAQVEHLHWGIIICMVKATVITCIVWLYE